MKLLLITSLILNVLMFGAAFRHRAHAGPTQFARPMRMEVTSPAASAFNFFKRRPPLANLPASPWQAIESRDPAKFIANLRAAGCPEQTIRDIVVTRVSREFHARLQAAHDDAERQQAWWRGSIPPRKSQELSQLRPALRRERHDLLEQLFGESANRLVSQVLAWPHGGSLGREFLSAEKRSPLRELEARYAQLSAEVTYPFGEPLDDEERATLADLKRRKRAEIDALLTTQELEELDLRESPAASYVLRKLPEALSEADFRAMVRAAREAGVGEDPGITWTSLASRYGMEAPNEMQQSREEAQRKAIDARIKELLGERRFALLQQAEAARQADEQARQEAERRAHKP